MIPNQNVPALSFLQPYGWLAATGIKPVDNRKRNFTYRGRLYIHASRYCLLPDFDLAWIFSRMTPDQCGRYVREAMPDSVLPIHAIIGEATVVNCVHGEPAWASKLEFWRWFSGPFGLVLTDAVLYDTPIPMMGALGLWYPDFETGRPRRKQL